MDIRASLGSLVDIGLGSVGSWLVSAIWESCDSTVYVVGCGL